MTNEITIPLRDGESLTLSAEYNNFTICDVDKQFIENLVRSIQTYALSRNGRY